MIGRKRLEGLVRKGLVWEGVGKIGKGGGWEDW